MGGKLVSLEEGPILMALSEPEYAPALIRVVRVLCAQGARSAIVLHAAEPAPTSEEVLERHHLSPEDLSGFVVEPVEGTPDRALLEAAHARHGSLIVLGLSPRHAEPGAVVKRLLTSAPCPVLLVPAQLREGWGTGGLVLLPLDGTPSTASVAPLAIQMSMRSGATLEVLFVGGAKPSSEPGSMGLPSFLDQPQHEWEMWKREFLYRFCDCYWGGKPPVDVRLFLATGEPGDAILDLAERHGPDLIVIGWHGELTPTHARTLRKVLRHARWPVLTSRV